MTISLGVSDVQLTVGVMGLALSCRGRQDIRQRAVDRINSRALEGIDHSLHGIVLADPLVPKIESGLSSKLAGTRLTVAACVELGDMDPSVGILRQGRHGGQVGICFRGSHSQGLRELTAGCFPRGKTIVRISLTLYLSQ